MLIKEKVSWTNCITTGNKLSCEISFFVAKSTKYVNEGCCCCCCCWTGELGKGISFLFSSRRKCATNLHILKRPYPFQLRHGGRPRGLHAGDLDSTSTLPENEHFHFPNDAFSLSAHFRIFTFRTYHFKLNLINSKKNVITWCISASSEISPSKASVSADILKSEIALLPTGRSYNNLNSISIKKSKSTLNYFN